MNDYEIKKILPVDNNLSLGECDKILVNEKFCLGVLDTNREITGFVLKKDLTQALKFNIDNYSIDLITTLANVTDDINNIKKYIRPGLNKAVFIGKSRQEIKSLILYKKFYENEEKFLYKEYKKNVSNEIKKVLNLCSVVADKISLPIFLVGGVVRDVIIGKKSFDIDITVEENAVEFSSFLKKEYPDIFKIKEIHEDFKTTKVIFNIDNKVIELDIASTRKELYRYPASLPEIREIGCKIEDDILRRDFTINSMALSLNKKTFCKLIDPLNGYDDLNKRKIRIIHPLSFIDDPARIIRALKFSIRFDSRIETATKQLAKSCIKSELFNNSGGERIKSEIKQTFNLNKAECLNRFIQEKIFFFIDKDILIPQNYKKLSLKCQNTIFQYKNFLSSGDSIWLIYLGILLAKSSEDQICLICERLHLSGFETEILLGSKSILNKIDLIKSAQTRFEIYEQFERYFFESIIISLIYINDKDIENKISLYLNNLQNIKIYTSGKTLIEIGLMPGPVFGEILRELLQAKINQKINTEKDEEEYIKNFISNYSAPS